MKLNPAAVRTCLKSFDFDRLFREHLGWEKHQASLAVIIDGQPFNLSAVAEKRGFVAYTCGSLPDRNLRLKIDHQVTKSSKEHFVIYCDKAAGQQVWHWVRRETGKPTASRDHRFDASQSGDRLIQRLEQIAVSLDEEDSFTLVDATAAARAAFDVDQVTKRFYDQFKTEHATFLTFIKGIQETGDLEWYTSLMLNRLMFVYFIQKKGFLDGDTDYLRNRLQMVREARGKDKFQSFYRYFLLRLFHEGLGKATNDRRLDAAMGKLLGKVPYLNGGFFEVHQLEERNAGIDIPDKAFEKLFDFFDRYSWHLDERELRADNEINPDVVGYIFEKYINQKQMGAYYTKEDITEYISKSTIIPFLFDAAEKKCPIAFQKGSFIWRLLSDAPDRYIYAGVRHGVVDEHGQVIPLPTEIEKGVKDVAKRAGWNRLAPAPFALPTETWREHISRRTRCLELRKKLGGGEVSAINDLVTLNLDLWQFARDAIVNAEGPEVTRAFWEAIKRVTVLDPTCGSGAFLFAALRILETLYSDCLECMERFVEDHLAKPQHAEQFMDFRKVLAQIDKHPNERYFVLKSIIIGNLFGVDIMEEAVEICKLRLFLKLVAQVDKVEQIEPLPDVDFNIRAGNTLVGYATKLDARKAFTERATGQGKLMLGDAEDAYKRFEEDAESVERAFRQFRLQQTTHGGQFTLEHKQELRRRLTSLNGTLDCYLASESGVDPAKEHVVEAWRSSHQPLHWFVQFYGIMRGGGFDVILGNPPYVNVPKALSRSLLRARYRAALERWSRDEDLYTLIFERCLSILNTAYGQCGLIVPLSLAFSTKAPYVRLRELLAEEQGNWWWSHYDRIPSALFGNDVRTRCTIAILSRSSSGRSHSTTALLRWTQKSRNVLFPLIYYSPVTVNITVGIPKLASGVQSEALAVLDRSAKNLGFDLTDSVPFEDLLKVAPRFPQPCVYVGGVAYNWFPAWRDVPETLNDKGKASLPARTAGYRFRTEEDANVVFALLCSSLGFWWWAVASDGFNLKKWLLERFPVSMSSLTPANRKRIAVMGAALRKELARHYVYKENKGRVGNYFLPACGPSVREIDSALAESVSGLSRAFFDDIAEFNSNFSRADVDGDSDDESEATEPAATR